MRRLFVLDKKDYDVNGTRGIRSSVRGIIIKNHKIAMIHSRSLGFFEIPGGGMEENEDKKETLAREIREETGLIVISESIKEYGYVHRIQKGRIDDIFEQYNYYYTCDVESVILPQKLEEQEVRDQLELEYVTPQYAIEVNRKLMSGYKRTIIERDTRVLELLMEEGYFEKNV